MSCTSDAIVAAYPDWQNSSLVIKMDVESYEGHALAGFSDLFRREQAVGIMEFDTHMLAAAGTDPETLFNRLTDRFSVFLIYPRKKKLHPIKCWGELRKHATEGTFHRDLAFFSRPDLIANSWNIV